MQKKAWPWTSSSKLATMNYEGPRCLVVASGSNKLVGIQDQLASSLSELGIETTYLLIGNANQRHPLAKGSVEVLTFRVPKPARTISQKVAMRTARSRIGRSRLGRYLPKSMLMDPTIASPRVTTTVAKAIRNNAPDIVIVVGYKNLEPTFSALSECEATAPVLYLRNHKSGSRDTRIITATELRSLPKIRLRIAAPDLVGVSTSIAVVLGKEVQSPRRDSVSNLDLIKSLPKTPENSGLHLSIGPQNYSAQAYFWASSVSSARPDIDTTVSAASSPFNFPADLTATAEQRRFDAAFLRDIRLRSASWTHVLIEGGAPIMGQQIPRALGTQVAALQGASKKVGLVFHGTDIRDPDAHMTRHPYSFFREGSDEWIGIIRQNSAKLREAAQAIEVPKFVSTPDLLLDMPDATWLPVVVDLAPWLDLADKDPNNQVPVVLHRPSRSDPPIKGTSYIEPVLMKLQAEGLIKYQDPEQCTHAEMQNYVGQCDIMVDQILTGSYGVAAVEALAAGRIVVGNVSNQVREEIGEPVPIVNSGPTTFEDDFRAILDDLPQLQQERGQRVEFAKKWHDGRRSAEVLISFIKEK